jgi:NAD(P)-dependent dehydrogenase (short-subunit alcohol dehydrogenase family)
VVISLRGKTIVITGASAGIGAAAARALAEGGATVIPIGRSPEKTAAIAAELGVEPIVTDFADFSRVRELAATLQRRVDRIDVFAHNAGGMNAERSVTTDGHELTWQTNYLGPFLLQSLIHEQLAASGARIIVTSSVAHHLGRLRMSDLDAHDRSYSMVRAYAASKLADLLFARQLARFGMLAVAFDPGFVSTDFLVPAIGTREPVGIHRVAKNLLPIVKPEIAAVGITRFATMDAPERVSGRLVSRSRPIMSSRASRSATLASDLWERSREVVG